MRIFLIDGHPDAGSYCEAVARSYIEGAQANGHEVRSIQLRNLAFDPVLHGGQTNPQPLEPALVEAQAAIRWCEHLVIVTPNWWSSMPALLKGFIDRVFHPGFGIEYLENFPYMRKLLKGRSARVIYTQNAPQWVLVLARLDLFWRTIRRAFLGPCGFHPTRRTVLGPIKNSTRAQREQWLTVINRLGRDGR